MDSSNEGIFVIGATNQPWDVDPALRRPGRFDRTMLLLPPDADARAAILRYRGVVHDTGLLRTPRDSKSRPALDRSHCASFRGAGHLADRRGYPEETRNSLNRLRPVHHMAMRRPPRFLCAMPRTGRLRRHRQRFPSDVGSRTTFRLAIRSECG